MSRLQAGALSVHPRPVALDEVVAAAVLHQPDGIAVEVDVPDDLPLAYADPGLMERVVANLLTNAHQASSAGSPVAPHCAARLAPTSHPSSARKRSPWTLLPSGHNPHPAKRCV